MMNNRLKEREKTSSRVAVYIRIGNEDKEEVKKQKILFKEYIEKDLENKIKTIKYYIDNGCSGNDINRKQLNNLINDYNNKSIDYIYTKNISRIARSFDVLQEIEKKGLNVKKINYLEESRSNLGINLYSIFSGLKEKDYRKFLHNSKQKKTKHKDLER